MGDWQVSLSEQACVTIRQVIWGLDVRRKKAKKHGFKSEADLCTVFIEAVRRQYPGEWVPYAETEGWDILLVRVKDGFQIGIQAKLTFNIAVINQCLEHWYSPREIGPDCRAVLVPRYQGSEFESICQYIGLTIISVFPPADKRFEPKLPTMKHGTQNPRWHEWCPLERHRLPGYVPDVVAGASAPVRLTQWKIKALRVVALIEIRGYALRTDFKHLGLDHRRWTVKGGWLVASPAGYVTGRSTPNFAKQHPVVYAQIKADFEKWAPPRILVEQIASIAEFPELLQRRMKVV